MLAQLVGVIKRMLCFLHITRRRKRSSSSILPLHTDVKMLSAGEIQTSLPSNDVELESWDVWISEDKASVTQTASGASRYGNRFQGMKPREPELEPEVDYFQQMQLEPSISKTKKVLVRKKDVVNSGTLSSRLTMSSDIPLPLSTSELGTLDDADSGGWADENDLSMEAESALREKRRAEREQRLVEHRQKKEEKEVSKTVTTTKGRMSAVKMS